MTFNKNLLFVFAAICFFSCQSSSKQEPQAADTLVSDIGSLGSDTLSFQVAKRYVHNYSKHAGFVDSVYTAGDLQKTKQLPDTRSVWFGLDRLEALVKKIKAEGGDGVRFYLATYDSTYTAKTDVSHVPPRDYWGYNTLVMVSTKDSLKKFHQDYYTTSAKAGAPWKGIIIGLGSDPENRGEMCPPPSNCNSIGATLTEQ